MKRIWILFVLLSLFLIVSCKPKKQAEYTINFETFGGTTIESQKSTSLKEVIPSKEGYDFKGWFLDAEFKIEVSNLTETIFYKDTTLYALFEEKIYKITYVVDSNVIKEEEYSISTPTFSLAPLTDENKKFLGWYLDGKLVEQIEKGTTGDMRLDGKFSKPYYTISFDTKGGENLESVSFEEGSKIFLPTPQKEEAEFLGWQLNYQNFEMELMPAYDIELVAKWKTKQYSIFYYDGDTLLEERKVNYNARIILPTKNKLDHKFIGWYLDGELFNLKNMPNYDIVLKGKWEIAYEEYSIIYDEQGGEMPIDYVTSYTYVTPSFTLPIPKKEGKLFYGWITSDDEIIKEVKTSSRGELFLTAVWVDGIYNVNYVLNGGNCDNLVTSFYSPLHTRILLPTPTKTGYAFLGYYTNSDFTSDEVLYLDSSFTSDITLYAKWKRTTLSNVKTVTIYGDSISTYEKYVPENALFYYPIYSQTVKSADKTWWKMMMEEVGLTLHNNISYSGSTVGCMQTNRGESDERIKQIYKFGESPDIIIIYLGINDCVSKAKVEDFEKTYENMLQKMAQYHPTSQVFVCTLAYETYTDGSNPNGSNTPGLRESYNEVIKELATKYDLPVIDFDKAITKATESMSNRYYLGDNIHPSFEGMKILATFASTKIKEFYME